MSRAGRHASVAIEVVDRLDADLAIGDCAGFRRVLDNLLRNAERYAASKIVVEVHEGDRDDEAVIEVRDDGPGVPSTVRASCEGRVPSSPMPPVVYGLSFPYIEFLPKPGHARGVQIDRDPTRIGLRYPVEVGLVGDCVCTLEALLPLLERKADRGFLEQAQKGMADWRDLMLEQATRRDLPMKPQVVAHELGLRLADDAIVSCDSSTVATWWARHIPATAGQMHSVSGTLATMACALPYAIAAQLAYPERQCVAFVGDGGFSMLICELATCVKYGLPVKIVVVKNNTLGQIRWEQMVFNGNPEYGCELQPIDFAAAARAFGAAGFSVDDPTQCGRVLDEALATPGPVVVEAVVDPFEPPMPPKTTAKQAMKLAKALVSGQPEAGKIMSTILEDKVRELV